LDAEQNAKHSEPRPSVASDPNTTTRNSDALAENLETTAHSRPVPAGLHIGGYLQAQYEASQLSEDQLQQGGVPLNADRFLLRRGRLRLDRGFEYAAATLELDANTVRGASVGVRRAEGSLLYRGNNAQSLPPLVMLSLGVTDLPFGYELAESARMRPFMERSTTSGALFPTEMDVGAKLSGAVSFVRYAVAITNGEPVDTITTRFPRDPNAAKDISGRFGVVLNPLENVGISGGVSFLTGKGFHPGSEATKSTVIWNDANDDGIATPNEIQGSPGQAATASENFERWAFGVDLQLELNTRIGASKLYAEAYAASNLDRGLLVADPVTTGLDQRHLGGYVALLQSVTPYGFVGFRASFYDPNADLLDTRSGRLLPRSAVIRTLSPLIGAELPKRARLVFQYDFIDDKLARDGSGVPTDAKNDQWTLRLQVEL
jgi:hypothetical protein